MARLREAFAWVSRESVSFVAKETIKVVLLTAAALVGTWLLSVIGEILQVDSASLSWAAIWQRIYSSIWDFLSRPVSFSLRSLTEDLARTLFTIGLVSGYLILFVLLRRANRRLKDASVERALALQAGIGGRWSHARLDADGAPWADLCAEIQRPENNILHILGANGAETFAHPGSPLYEAINTFHGQTRVILLHPDGETTSARARSVDTNVATYRAAIRNSVGRLRELRRKQLNVEGRYYWGQPNWKMIITARTAWVQYYLPHGGHVNETPVWRLDATQHGAGLYHVFQMEFERIWRRCESDPMELD